VTQFTISIGGGGAHSTTASTGVAYSTVHRAPAPVPDPGWHTRVPRPHEQHHEVAAAPRFQPELLHPALPIEWIVLVPVAAIVALHLGTARRNRFTATRAVV